MYEKGTQTIRHGGGSDEVKEAGTGVWLVSFVMVRILGRIR